MSSTHASRRSPVLALGLALALLSGGCDDESPHLCVPTTCEDQGHTCGTWDDGCGTPLACGACDGILTACGDDTGVCECVHETCDATCCGADERCAGGACVARGWYGVVLTEVHAPDEHTIRVSIDAVPTHGAAERLEAYAVTSDHGDLDVTDMAFDADALTITLTTARQKLGVSYGLSIDTGPEAPGSLDASFLAADTARFWASDFSDPNFAQYEVTAERVAVGERCVLYVEEGQSAYDAHETRTAFDERIFPRLTQAFTDAPDRDGNGRVVLLGLNGEDYYGGYFYPVDAYSDEETMGMWGLHSNEKELINVNVSGGSFFPVEVVPHEFTHLLYHARHGFTDPYWDYHDEGLAECGTHLANDGNAYAPQYYLADPTGAIATGLSLVHWSWGDYTSYAQAYLFWIYLASRVDGLATLGALFDLDTGDPDEVSDWIATQLGGDLASLHRQSLLATWIQAPTGLHGYEGLVEFPDQPVPAVPVGTTSVDLEAWAGAFFHLDATSLDYPGTQGTHVTYASLDATGDVDLAAPFDVGGGMLLVYNASNDRSWTPEHSGPDLAAVAPPTLPPAAAAWISPAWLSPPPLHPGRRDALRAWQARAWAHRDLARAVLGR
jgi:hypothetical protein